MNFFKLLFICFTTAACSQDNEPERVIPNWKVGDYRLIKTSISSYSRVNNDTIFSVSNEKLHRITVNAKSNDFYTLEVVNLSKPNLNFNHNIDSLGDNLNEFVTLIQNFPKLSIPYELKVSNNGKIEEILDWNDVFSKFSDRLIKISDSLNINLDHSALNQYFESNDALIENFLYSLAEEISDNFDLYNTILPIDSVISEIIEFPNPITGEILGASAKYRTLSKQDDVYQIEMRIELDDELILTKSESLDNLLNNGKKDREIISTLENISMYYWNSKTSWIDSTSSYLHLQLDTIEVVMTSKTSLYK